ncbi:Fungal Zn2-Cys6 binuclear cluster domain containing protein [Nitzschia inconspicua]|uniref:Fungal Zn2-Cys6 binuclear cluster domain containing protein n=1 Tax=Nitzschia inconspicua TaxID=303405 RepID=A0A9K3L1Y4_9STRA|nr:Fungal Zn2-Cys6 binuclear cluster domain containing protein [Nitzschia inconspicua]
MPEGDNSIDNDQRSKDGNVALCASCDRCRSRKTKCDGNRPCSNCAAKYMKKHKLTSVEGLDPNLFDCVYSPAKRRGPVPGRSGQSRKATEAFGTPSRVVGMNGNSMETGGGNDWSQTAATMAGMHQVQSLEELQLRQMMLQNMGAAAGMSGLGAAAAVASEPSFFDSQQAAIQQQLNLIQQLQAQQAANEQRNVLSTSGAGAVHRSSLHGGMIGGAEIREPVAQKMKLDPPPKPTQSSNTDANGVPKTIAAHTHLLELSDPDGSRLRAYYRLSVDELFGFPPTPTDEEYCMRLNIPGMTPRMIPGTHLAALSAARFAEVALGAIVHNEVSLGMELCNAVVHCLKESVQEPVQPPYMFEVARSYFLLGVFRAFRGDMLRYFKYRRVCLTYVSKLENDANAATLLAAIAFLDAWAYMIYNADEKKLPKIDDSIPPVERPPLSMGATATEMEYNIKTNPGNIASDPRNQNWIQGAPPVYLNNEAPLPARSLDALACAVRTCCDQANGRFAAISKEAKTANMETIPQETIITPTTTAVLAHENELCSRNMVLSAFTLLQQYEAATPSSHKNQGIHLVISAMDAFLDNGDEDETGGFTDSQIQSLLSVCNTVIENPLLLHHGGPTYHMVTNSAVMLCHLLNGMYAMKGADGVRKQGDMEAAMFEEVLDTFTAVRKLLVIHRRKLPVKLRCHGIPRPSLGLPEEGKPFIDLGETLLCACRGCQGFVLMACSPCVAAERALAADNKRRVEAAREAQIEAADDMDRELDELSNDFNLDDDALLGMLSQLIST